MSRNAAGAMAPARHLPRSIRPAYTDDMIVMDSEPAREVGRPTRYTDEIADELERRISGGESLRSACEREGMPDKSTVLDWVAENRHNFRPRYIRARSKQAQVIADEVLDRARAAHDVGSASAATAFTKAAQLLLPAFDRATFGQQQHIEVHQVRQLSDEELRIRLIEALAKEPKLIPLALARDASLEPELRARGLLQAGGGAGEAGGAGGATPPLPPT